MIFLIEYDRSSGKLVHFQEFDDSERDTARKARSGLELTSGREGNKHEVVILEAPNEEAVRHTHSRYFQTLNELIASSTARASDKDGH